MGAQTVQHPFLKEFIRNGCQRPSEFSAAIWRKTIAFKVGCIQYEQIFINLLGEHCQVDLSVVS